MLCIIGYTNIPHRLYNHICNWTLGHVHMDIQWIYKPTDTHCSVKDLNNTSTMERFTSTLIVISLVVYYTSALNCSYELLEESLLNSNENKYELSRAFFPSVDNPPEFVTVNYYFPNRNENKLCFWSAFTSGFIHPPEVLQFISLFFAKPHTFYNGSVNLVLDNLTLETTDCADDLLKMQLLTQRVSPCNILHQVQIIIL